MQKPLKILISDDSLLLRKKLREELEKLSCQVVEAKDGEEVIELYNQFRPDGVFMDIVMPKANGIDALKKIKEIDQEARVIMLSSTGTAANLLEALKLGAIDFIQKPYNSSQIVKAVNDMIRKEN
ncbi:response regulator [Pelosinus propionicus]|uniref:Two-component system, chemotaxis family, response regulator CheY n=1 Tax=Pelosinus propionicus DSM 13327 TaxID=1123291 RepID=A0A1I4LDD5_9FIRM|nr:response regulator [Pelosinus propionicus]SFL89022.1 two-component system, chemotaxis family, response regulator CheY [Pelosinus propionicus DSM 13327]